MLRFIIHHDEGDANVYGNSSRIYILAKAHERFTYLNWNSPIDDSMRVTYR